MEKKTTKVSLSTMLLIIAIIVIIVMGYFIYRISKEKVAESEKVVALESAMDQVEERANTLHETIQNVKSTVNNTAMVENTKNETKTEKIQDSINSNVTNKKSSVSVSKVLELYRDMILNHTDSLYSIFDINNDNIPELFIYTTGTIDNYIIADTKVYTYDEDKGDESNHYILYIGSVSGRIDTNTALYKMNDGQLLAVYGYMGYERTEYYTLENCWLIRNKFSFRETNDYLEGDVYINFVKCTDTALIDNYK